MTARPLSRRKFLIQSGLFLAATSLPFPASADVSEPVIDIHQHTNYSGRSDADLLSHQRAMGISKTILLPAGRPVSGPVTHNGVSNGLEAKCTGNEACYRFAMEHPGEFTFAANEVPTVPGATAEIEKYLKLGAVAIGEQKVGIECDSSEMQKIYSLARDYKVPVLMHWQFQRFNYGFERFHKMLEKFSEVIFIGHAQTWWANVDKDYIDHLENNGLYPKTKITPGGLTDRYLREYPNMFGDLSAGSGLNALLRDEDHAREFLTRHQDKLIYGSDCNDPFGYGPKCQGSQTISAIKRLASGKKVERKLLYENARKLFRI